MREGESSRTGAGKAILFAEDEAVLREMGCKALRRCGFEVHGASDGSQALEIFRAAQEEIGLVVLDWGLPGCAGIDLLRALYSIRLDLSILVTTGGRCEELAHLRPPEAGRLRLLAKPFRAYELLAVVASMLAERDELAPRLAEREKV